ncbi:hypothetical protein SELMODRAFT_440305 [Selaginella moellendorffii]|uniref:CG-1 domain-containing protein n=1 Tax=Selaginella moellendorffii TaxID=88036 RepID=D8RAW3_SELML|nr:hypothetical protein SELMODRAFT_440305 [Selaginella moellendorffii]
MRQIIQEACVRWLKPHEVCDILRNYQSYGFDLNSLPPNRPASGSLFLFDRKAVRCFRKDGHNWKKEGQAHERLKSGSIDVLHCYYARGEEDPNFQRSYWMLEGYIEQEKTNMHPPLTCIIMACSAYEHIVLVHYLQVHQGRESAYGASPEHPEPFSHSEHGDSSDHVEQMEQLFSKDSLLSETQSGQGGNLMMEDRIDLNDILDSPDMFLGQKPLSPAVSLDMSGWKEVLRSYRENPTNGPVKQEDSDALEQRTTVDASPGQVKFDDGIMFKLSPEAIPSPKAIIEVLSQPGLGRQPHTLLEAQLRAATAENAMKTAQSLSLRWRESVFSRPPAQNVLVDMGRSSRQEESDIKSLASFGPWALAKFGNDDDAGALLEAAPSVSSSVWAAMDVDKDREETSNLPTPMELEMSAQFQRFSITDL